MIVFGKALTAAALTWPPSRSWSSRTTDHHPDLARWSILSAMFGCTLVVTLVIDTVVGTTRSLTASGATERKRTEAPGTEEIVAARVRQREADRGPAFGDTRRMTYDRVSPHLGLPCSGA
jgi:hypothetical protein